MALSDKEKEAVEEIERLKKNDWKGYRLDDEKRTELEKAQEKLERLKRRG